MFLLFDVRLGMCPNQSNISRALHALVCLESRPYLSRANVGGCDVASRGRRLNPAHVHRRTSKRRPSLECRLILAPSTGPIPIGSGRNLALSSAEGYAPGRCLQRKFLPGNSRPVPVTARFSINLFEWAASSDQ